MGNVSIRRFIGWKGLMVRYSLEETWNAVLSVNRCRGSGETARETAKIQMTVLGVDRLGHESLMDNFTTQEGWRNDVGEKIKERSREKQREVDRCEFHPVWNDTMRVDTRCAATEDRVRLTWSLMLNLRLSSGEEGKMCFTGCLFRVVDAATLMVC
ncbi:uncharacterized protein EAE97_003663 [Botrytis byssoidea]|uniref:Uncharacterized protein n=1 Tax=Botrytis byssoidea TaxID=139641 RepID=A0A9P5IS29_9HELO|nr:uncharacterized protein EAE97_003663 [Botrytis byssoidea]KAF7948252.1 hypothetical protein EAE97_003663 [Botrytis byssoidea]